MARALVKNIGKEVLRDYQYLDFQSILLPSSSIIIGTGNTLNDGSLYTAADLTWSFTNGTGDNGLDTGTELSQQWYALYAVPKTETTYVLKASVNAPPQAGGAGPVGFTKYRYLGLFKQGTNAYDPTNGSFGIGDIVRFVKIGRQIEFRSINSTNGGVFPSASGMNGLCISTGNSSTNGILIDMAATSNFGFAGANVNGNGVKLPYIRAQYIMEGQFNGTTANSLMRRTDSVANDRQYIPMTIMATLTRSPQFLVGNLPQAQTGPTWDEQIRMDVAGNLNISRFLQVSAMIDPYIVGSN